MWYNRPLKKRDSARVAKGRLLSILAEDRVNRKTRQPTLKDFQRVFLNRIQPTLMLHRMESVHPMKYEGQVIKWREPTPFNYTENNKL